LGETPDELLFLGIPVESCYSFLVFLSLLADISGCLLAAALTIGLNLSLSLLLVPPTELVLELLRSRSLSLLKL